MKPENAAAQYKALIRGYFLWEIGTKLPNHAITERFVHDIVSVLAWHWRNFAAQIGLILRKALYLRSDCG